MLQNAIRNSETLENIWVMKRLINTCLIYIRVSK
nr:MAG TPA: integrase [Caudoviricetes sp.]DAR39661.1 MAG TPA: integrase [Caudoviricetes sp.]